MFGKVLGALGLVAILSFTQPIYGQCSNFMSNYPSGQMFTNSDEWTEVNSCVFGGDFQEYRVVEGAEYSWTSRYSGNPGLSLSLWSADHEVELARAGSEDQVLTWTSSFTGVVHVLLSEEGCEISEACNRVDWMRGGVGAPPSHDLPCNALMLPVGPSCTYTTSDNYGSTNSGIAAPGCGWYAGEDVWFSAVVPASGIVDITTNAGFLQDAVMSVYTGTCSSLSLIGCSDDVNGYMPELNFTGLSPGQTIFIRIFAYAAYTQGDFSICVIEPCSAPPSNNLFCNAEMIDVGTEISGNNDCADNTSDPSTPGCWTGGSVNSVWYSFTAPSSGDVWIEANPLTIQSTQMALYDGTCSISSLLDCNTLSSAVCGNTGASSIEYYGLTPGSTYYIRIDGQGSNEGTFNLEIIDLADGLAQFGGDCSEAISVCSDNFSVGDPGPFGTGAVCDFDGSGTCTGGETNSLWYQIDVGATGNFLFTLTPNDGGVSSCGTETDYDFVLWKISGSGTTTDCSQIRTNGATGLLACNYSSRGVIGISSDGNAPPGYSTCFNNAFEAPVSVTNGDVLLLVVQNYDGATIGFSLDMTASDPGVVSTSVPSEVYWSGGVDTDWNDSQNWGNCGASPGCTTDAILPTSPGFSPVLSGVNQVRDLTIEEGGILILSAGSQLTICGDLTNDGIISMDPTATLTVNNGTINQYLDGNFTGSSAIGNLVIDKPGGTVFLGDDMEIQGDFLTASSTSRFNTGGNSISLAGNFRNDNGSTTFRGISSTGALIFNGTTEQSYSQGSSNLGLNEVIIQNSGAGVTLLTDMRIKNTTGSLELIDGIVKTGSNQVYIRNNKPWALNEGNSGSYIEGELRRFTATTGLFHFPLGHASTGYQRADVFFRNHLFSNVTAEFEPWTTNPGPLMESECMAVYDLDALDTGFLTITPNANASSADYDITLYNTAYGNHGTAQGWTVMKDAGSGWELVGDCQTSSVDTVYRTGLMGFSRFATAQSSSPLPIELLSFDGEPKEQGNQIYWSTASEINNESFKLESSRNGIEFEQIFQTPGAGNSSGIIDYSFMDRNAGKGLTYYRLTQTDYDGTSTKSDIIAIDRMGGLEESSVFPNPATHQVKVTWDMQRVEIEEVVVRNMLSKVIHSQVLEENERENGVVILDISAYKEGVYAIIGHNREGEKIYFDRLIKE